MIIKNFLNKINISIYTVVLIIISMTCGLFKEIVMVLIMIIIHEFGHYFISSIYKWNIKRITIYPFGGITIYEEMIDKPLYEEFIITIFGPIFQIMFFLIIKYLYSKYLISDYLYNVIYNYNIGMLVFNLLPIIPLDGSKILNIILNKIFNFRISYYVLCIISFVFILLFSLRFNDNYSNVIIISFLIYQLISYYKNRKYIFNRFVFEKYLYKNTYTKYKKINNINEMKRNRKHLIRYNNIYMTEKESIKKIKGV